MLHILPHIWFQDWNVLLFVFNFQRTRKGLLGSLVVRDWIRLNTDKLKEVETTTRDTGIQTLNGTGK